MMRAAGFGKAELVAFLLERGADPRAKDTTGRSAAAYADRAGRADLAELLVARGADAQRWVEPPRPARLAVKREEPVDLVTKIGCVTLAVSALPVAFFWLLVRFG